MNCRSIKTAVLGAGSIVPAFLEAAAEIDELEVYAVFGRESALPRMEELQRKHGISKIYHDYEELLMDSEVEAVYVALPNHLHYEFAKKAVESKKHVIMEKPFASTCGQAIELIDLACQNRVMIFEGISNQYLPNYEKTRELAGTLGNIKIVQMNYSQYSKRYDLFKRGIVLPVFDPEKSGGALMDLNVYNVHYIVGLFGKPDRVHYIANLERGIDTSGILTLEYPSFQCVSVGAKDCMAPASISIQGDKGYIHSDDKANGYDSFVCAYNGEEPTTYALNGGRPRLYHELRVFTDMVIRGDYEEAQRYNRRTLDVMEILEEARHQVGIDWGV